MRRVLPYMLVVTLLVTTCQAQTNQKFVPKSQRNKEKYSTPEPGTYLKPLAYTILKEFNKVIEDPESYKEPADWILKMLSTPQKKVVDTILTYQQSAVPVRIYYPTRKSLQGNHGLILFIHGGGFIYGSVDEYHMMVSKLAKLTDQIIVSVEYRLAPEHPFPAGVNDCYTALRWLQENAACIGGDKENICLMGDSAGGNIATVLSIKCRDDLNPIPRAQVLIYPGVTFVDTLYPSRIYFGQSEDMNYILDEAFLRKVRIQYMGEETNDRNPYLSPLEAHLSSDLPPALIITAECDPIRDDGRLYAAKLMEAGVPVEHIEFSGMIHGFMSFHMILGDAVIAMKTIRNYLEKL